MIDLFGNLVLEMELPVRREKGKRKEIPKGYAAAPGTGPKGEHCASCQFAVKARGGRLYYWKCLLRKLSWSSCGHPFFLVLRTNNKLVGMTFALQRTHNSGAGRHAFYE